MSKEEFKEFVKTRPNLIKYVKNGDITWQGFYEMYSLYGEDNNIWNNYLDDVSTTSNETTVKELISMVKGIDLTKVHKGIEGMQRAVTLLQDLGGPKSDREAFYERKPTYRHLDD